METEQHTDELELCTYCPKLCRHVCPVSNASGCEALIPQAKMQILNMMRRNAVAWHRDYVEALYGCTGCRLCQQYCKHGNVVAEAMWAGRADAQRERGISHPALERLPERFRGYNERLRQKLESSHLRARMAREARVGFLPGAHAIESSIEDIDDAFEVFDSLGIDFVRLVDAPLLCGGYPLWAGGFTDAARFAAEEMVRQLRSFSTMVVGDPALTHLLRVRMPEEGFEHNTEVLHISEFLAVHAERLSIVRRRPAAYFHDPCYLGRYLGVYDPPRRLLSRCVESVREFFHSRELAECCGGGGLVPLTFPQVTARQAHKRLEEARLFGVDLVVTACPTCKRTLRDAHPDVEVLDLINLIAWSLRPPSRLPERGARG